MTQPASPIRRQPVSLAVAAGVAALEGLALLVYGIIQIPAITTARIVMGATDAGFFLLYGGFLLFAAFKLSRGHSWAWAPIMLAQLLQITVGYTWGDPGVAAVLVVPGVIAAAALLMPASIRALRGNLTSRWTAGENEEPRRSDDPSTPAE